MPLETIKEKNNIDIDLISNTIICGNALSILPQFSNESIDCIITDPPFMASSKMKISRSSNTKYGGKHGVKDIDRNYGKWDAQWNNIEDYMLWCCTWLDECIRVLKPYCHLVFFFDRMKVTPVWAYLENNGMKGRGFLQWLKSNPVPRGRKVDFMRAFETAIWFTKTAVKVDYFNWQLGQQLDYVKAAIPQHPRYHPTQKPVSVLEVWVNYLTKPNDIVLDPFCGSGSTLVATKQSGRRYIGIEQNNVFVNISQSRVDATSVPLSNILNIQLPIK
jgi:site-specific DNA-methyltransferase (adenine-specific)